MQSGGSCHLYSKPLCMKTLILAVLAALPGIAWSQYTYDKLQVNFLTTDTEAKAYTYGNLRLYPIRAKDEFKKTFRDLGKYIPLQEALEKKKVKISEKGDGGSVNTLTIENLSADTIIVITGEVIKGGKQDRIINKDMVLAPKSGKKDLPVFCVESGRWSYRNTTPARDFSAHEKIGAMGLRKVVEKEQQQDRVWTKVEEINTANKTQTSTKTYTAITSSVDFNKKTAAYVQFFRNKLAAEQDLIGVIVVSGDKVLGCDMFATNDLFKKNIDNLLHSYAAEAILNGKPVSITSAKVKTYMDGLLKNEQVQVTTLKEKGNSFIEKGKKLRVSSFD